MRIYHDAPSSECQITISNKTIIFFKVTYFSIHYHTHFLDPEVTADNDAPNSSLLVHRVITDCRKLKKFKAL